MTDRALAGFRKRQAAEQRATSWKDNWENTKGGFNPDVFEDLDEETRNRLASYQIGPRIVHAGDKPQVWDVLHSDWWGDPSDTAAAVWTGTGMGPRGESLGYYTKSDQKGGAGYNRGNVQNAVWEMGLANIKDKDALNEFLDRTDALTAKHGNFLDDGWDPEDILLYREKFEEPVPEAVADPVVTDPVEPTVEVPVVVEETPVIKEQPVKGVDYMTEDMQDTAQRIRDYNTGFSPENWIAQTSERDSNKQATAQRLADTYKFKVNPDLDDAIQNVTTRIPGALGVFSGYHA